MTGSVFCWRKQLPANHFDLLFSIIPAFTMSSLIPGRQIVFSAELAATLGLEEAILLQYLSDESENMDGQIGGQFKWFQLSAKQIKQRLPFWQDIDIQRVIENLRQQGVVILSSAPITESHQLRFAFNDQKNNNANNQTEARPEAPQHSPPPDTRSGFKSNQPRANAITQSWRADEHSIRLLAQQGVPAHFAHEQTGEFVQYWSERGEARHSWGSKFVSHVLYKWRDYETRQQKAKPSQIDSTSWEATKSNEPQPLAKQWRPSTDACEILEIQAGINRNFIEDSLPEFILYWMEKGDRCNTWNARFISHVKRQWAEFEHKLKNESRPSVMTADWQPSDDVYDVLKFARIDLEFVRHLVPEFVMYWRDRNELRPSWNTLFLQFAKLQWQRQNHLENSLKDNSLKATRERSLVEDLSDRSWAN